jgi:glutamate dehydrogenase/leucine dehydrogenase
VAREAAKKLGIDFKKSDVAVQGFGNVGYYSAKFMQEFGCTIVALSDSKGGIFNSEGDRRRAALAY